MIDLLRVRLADGLQISDYARDRSSVMPNWEAIGNVGGPEGHLRARCCSTFHSLSAESPGARVCARRPPGGLSLAGPAQGEAGGKIAAS